VFRTGCAVFACEVHREREHVRVRLVGELDLATVPEARSRVDGLLTAGTRSVFIDLSALDFVDSAGIRFVDWLASEAEAAGVECVFGAARPAVQRLCALSGASLG
jgi:anti-sigma B factor antagonist